MLSSEDLDKGVEVLDGLSSTLGIYRHRDARLQEVGGEIQERAAGLIASIKPRAKAALRSAGDGQEILPPLAMHHDLAIGLASAGNKNGLKKPHGVIVDAALNIEAIGGGGDIL